MSTPNGVPTGADVCTDLTPVDLTPFKDLPKFKDLPVATQASEEVQTIYKTVEAYQKVDSKGKDGYGNGDGKVDQAELEKFLAANILPGASACTLLREVRLLSQKVPQLKTSLTQPTDLTPVELAPLRALPYLEEFLKFQAPSVPAPSNPKDPKALDDYGNKYRAAYAESMTKAGIPAPLQELLMKNESVQIAYMGARLYLTADQDHDGKLSIQDLEKLKEAGKIPAKDPNTDPGLILAEARTQVPQFGLLGFQLQGRLRIKGDPNRLDLTILAGLYSKAPKFVEGNPDLKALLDIVGKKNEKGEIEFIPDAIDGALTLDELKKNGEAMMALKLKNTTPEAFFTKVQDSIDQIQYPLYLWPADLKAKLKEAGQEAFQAVQQMAVLNESQHRSELALHFLEETDQGKYDQEKMDHAGPAGNSYMGWIVGHVAGWIGYWDKAESWNQHFQETKPNNNKKERGEAIEALKKVMREKPNLDTVQKALSYMEDKSNGLSSHADALKAHCDIETWIRTADIKDDLDRYKALDRIGDEYRAGSVKDFMDWQIVPLPRLGEGGFFNRASKLSNWTWIKSPDLPITLAIDNYLAQGIPNTYQIDNQGKTEILSMQLKEAEKKSFDELIEKALKGEYFDAELQGWVGLKVVAPEQKTAEEILSKSTLTAAGQKVLIDRYNAAVQTGQNKKLFDEVSALEYVKGMSQENLQKVNGIFGAAAGGTYKVSQLEHELEALNLSSANTSNLKTYLARVQAVLPPDETGGMNTLFQEAQLGANEARAREIFNKISPSDDEKKEFKTLVEGSSLSNDNRQLLNFAFDHQAENRIATAAHQEFFQILGNPTKDPMDPSGKAFDPKSVGNLHNSIRTTVDRGVGLGIMATPTLVGGGVGYSLAKAPMTFDVFGKKAPFPLVIGTAGGAVGYFTAEPEHRVRNAAIGFGIGTGVSYGLSRFVKGRGLNPWWGALALGVVGSIYTAGTWKGGVGEMGWEVMQTPYRPWSDFSVRDMPAESLGIYLDFAVGTKAMGSILDGIKLVGAMELVQKTASFIKVSPLGARKAVGIGLGMGMGGLQGYDMTSANADTSTKIRNILGGAAAGGLFSYGLYKNKLITFTAAGAATGGYIGYNAVDPEDMGNTKKRIQYAMVGAAAGGGLVYLMGRGVAHYFKAGDKMFVADAASKPKGSWISPWAEAQHAKTLEQISSLEGMTTVSAQNVAKVEQMRVAAEAARTAGEWKKYNELLEDLAALEKSPRLIELRQMALAYEKLGKVGVYPHFSANVLAEAERLSVAGNLDKANFMIVRGANELALMEKGGMANSRIAKLLLTGFVADKVDGKIKPPTPLIPPFSVDFNGTPRKDPVPVPNSGGGF